MTRQHQLPGRQRLLPGRPLQVPYLILLFFHALIASTDFSIRLGLLFLCYSLALSYAAPQTKEPDLLEVLADIGRVVVDEAAELVAAEGHDLAVGDEQGSLAVMENSS